MSLHQRLLPQPFVTLAIVVLWMLLATSPSLGNLLLGLAVGLAIPPMTQSFWPDRPQTFRPLMAVRLAIVVFYDIVKANLEVARLVLGPIERIRPSFVEIPLDTGHPFVATIFGSIVSLTPGTVSIEIDSAKRILLVHALDVADEATLIATAKARYEAPLMEIFGC